MKGLEYCSLFVNYGSKRNAADLPALNGSFHKYCSNDLLIMMRRTF